MSVSNPTDVNRALAAIGATPIRYRSFGKQQLRTIAAYVATPAILDDTVNDPFAPQAMVHVMDETQPDVLLPANLPTPQVPVIPLMDLSEATPPRLPATDHPSHVALTRAEPELMRAAPEPEPERAPVEAASPCAVPAKDAEAVASLAPVVAPIVASTFVARATMAPAGIPVQSAAPLLPSLGTRIAARETIPAEASRSDLRPLSIGDMFRVLNERSVANLFAREGARRAG